jgi:hypothetical protein
MFPSKLILSAKATEKKSFGCLSAHKIQFESRSVYINVISHLKLGTPVQTFAENSVSDLLY